MKSVAFVVYSSENSNIAVLIIPFKSVNYIKSKHELDGIVIDYFNGNKIEFDNKKDSAQDQLDNYRRWLIKENLK